MRRYLHSAIDIGLGAVNIAHPLLDGADWRGKRTAAQVVLDRLVDTAQRDEAISSDIAATDIAFATVRVCRPLAIGLDTAEERAIAHDNSTATPTDSQSRPVPVTHSRRRYGPNRARLSSSSSILHLSTTPDVR